MKTQAVTSVHAQEILNDDYDPPLQLAQAEQTEIPILPNIRMISGGKPRFAESPRSLAFRKTFFSARQQTRLE